MDFHGQGGDAVFIGSDSVYELLPVILIEDVPVGYLSNHIIRLVGVDLNTEELVTKAFSADGRADKLEIVDGSSTILLTAVSQETGVDQHLFCITSERNNVEIDKVALFLGDYLDIDNWMLDNFTFNENLIA